MKAFEEHFKKERDFSDYPEEVLFGAELGWLAAIKWIQEAVIRDAWNLDDVDDWLDEELNS